MGCAGSKASDVRAAPAPAVGASPSLAEAERAAKSSASTAASSEGAATAGVDQAGEMAQEASERALLEATEQLKEKVIGLLPEAFEGAAWSVELAGQEAEVLQQTASEVFQEAAGELDKVASEVLFGARSGGVPGDLAGTRECHSTADAAEEALRMVVDELVKEAKRQALALVVEKVEEIVRQQLAGVQASHGQLESRESWISLLKSEGALRLLTRLADGPEAAMKKAAQQAVQEAIRQAVREGVQEAKEWLQERARELLPEASAVERAVDIQEEVAKQTCCGF